MKLKLLTQITATKELLDLGWERDASVGDDLDATVRADVRPREVLDLTVRVNGRDVTSVIAPVVIERLEDELWDEANERVRAAKDWEINIATDQMKAGREDDH